MRSRLIETDAQGREHYFPLKDAEVILGRDPTCDVPVACDDVSWRHALIRPSNGRHIFVDLDSTNGSTVNRRPITAPRALSSGDVIGLAGVVELEYEELGVGAARLAIIALAGVAACALVAAAILLWPGAEPPDPVLEEAKMRAEQGIAAARAGDQFAARDHLRAAAGLLYTGGYLDNVERGDLQRSAMQLLQNHLDVSFDLWSFYDNVLRTPQPIRKQTATPTRLCRLDLVRADELEACLTLWISRVMVEIHQDPDSVPPDFHREVGTFMRQNHDFLESSIERGEKFVPMLRRELQSAKMPPLLHYLALIESGYRNSATSDKAAAGIWQFMPATGRQYGLRIGSKVDERRDPEKATRAASHYLRDLTFEFGGNALLLSLAGYNRGENGVRRALKKLDDPFSDRSYWRLRERNLLPEQTKDYVPRFIAAAVAGEGGLPDVDTLERAGY